MLYDLGKVSAVSRFGWFLASASIFILSAFFACIMLALLVRIGNAVLGW